MNADVSLFHLIVHLVFRCLFLCYLNFLCLCLFLFHKCELGLFHLIAHLVFLCYLNFLCLCLFHKCETGLFHLTTHLVFLCYLNFLCLFLFLFHKCERGVGCCRISPLPLQKNIKLSALGTYLPLLTYR